MKKSMKEKLFAVEGRRPRCTAFLNLSGDEKDEFFKYEASRQADILCVPDKRRARFVRDHSSEHVVQYCTEWANKKKISKNEAFYNAVGSKFAHADGHKNRAVEQEAWEKKCEKRAQKGTDRKKDHYKYLAAQIEKEEKYGVI